MRRVFIVVLISMFYFLVIFGRSIAGTPQENVASMQSAIGAWEQQWSNSDPEYGIKKDRVLDRLELLLARAQKTNTLPKTVEEAIALAEKARKDVEADFNMIHENNAYAGTYSTRTREEHEAAAAQGDAISQFYLGVMYQEARGVKQDYVKAYKWYEKAATQGLASAQSNLGFLYSKGYGVEQSYSKSREWLEKAAAQGEPLAQFKLGLMYEDGYGGVKQDYAKASEWYEKAALQGNPVGQYSLGRLYASGRGVAQDYVLSYMWINLAAAQGLEDALEFRDFASRNLTPSQIEDGQRMTREWMATKGKADEN